MNKSDAVKKAPRRSAWWGVLLAIPALVVFTPIAFHIRKPLGVPPPAQGYFDHVPRDVPAEYWWSWALALAIIASLGLGLLMLRRTRKAAIVYLVLALTVSVFQMLAVRSYEYNRWDTGDSYEFAPQEQR